MSSAIRPSSPVTAPGFENPARDAQRTFRSILDALAHPTSRYPLDGPDQPPAGVSAGLAAVLLTLLDEECTVWLDPRFADDAELSAWLAFHTGVHVVEDPGAADFALTGADTALPLSRFSAGTDEAPHRSTTLIVDTLGVDSAMRLIATGPGIDGAEEVSAPWASSEWIEQWMHNHELFPRGVDVVLVAPEAVIGIPRTTRLIVAERATDQGEA